ncbi:hypothetical protein P43SY_006309 [Pythium insidiosum]|uniref:Amino acid transporter transmembrane domain-containing protein n=1 Tax=Pythium insidiosum TaxID=114742 RepID=A0AAD5M483_PYTIN|nr:hypothetical protein P43SY_006309 [Pythium insidiosum]
MMPLREVAAPSELTTALLDGHAEHGDATVGVAEEDLRLSDGDDSDYEIVPTRETLVFDDEYGARRVALDDAKAAGFFQMYLMDKIQPGSVKGSMFTMTVAIVGAGVLALPYAVEQSGLLLGLALITGGALVTNFSLRLLLSCAELANARSYMDLSFITGGSRLAALTQFVVCLNLFGTSVGYLVGSAELLQLAMKSFLGDATHSVLVDRQNLILLLCTCFVLPLALFRSLESLRFTSLFSILCITFMTLVIVIKYFQFVHLGYTPDIMYQLHHLRLFDWRPQRLLTAIPLVIFVYTCHPNVLPIYLVLKRRSSRRMYKVMNRSIGLSAAVYCLCGAFVVFTFGEHTKSNFLKNDYHRDVAVLIGCIGFSVALILTVPLFLHTLRDNLREALLENRRLSVVQHAIVSAFLVFSVFTVAELSGDIASVLGVLGATTNPVICFLLPAYFVHRVGPASLATRKWIALVIAMLASAVSVCSVLHQLQVLA